MRVLTLQDTYDLLDMSMTLEALDGAYRDLGEGNAANVGRADLLSPGPLPGSFHGFKTMSGSLPRRGVSALRLNSDIVTWPVVNGQARRVTPATTAQPGGNRRSNGRCWLRSEACRSPWEAEDRAQDWVGL